ncbi:MAG: DUF4442 domain-containing protein [Cyclobacteriaceae bacterium]|nr:DUF4442 domain-containing protein [Cyclobacteriaceae bacterium]MCH8515324.1 DUF4442 domain-containing protein [Cyclobacteriaceae bacterium]
MESQAIQQLNAAQEKFLKRMRNPFIFWWAMLVQLPSVIFWGVRLKSISTEKCEITIPYKWRSQNPFRSIYFAALAGAAELSTGALALLALEGKGKHSMLVVDFKSEFYKKADQKITFTCHQAQEVLDTIDNLDAKGGADTLMMISEGKNPKGETVAKFFITWSFKKK